MNEPAPGLLLEVDRLDFDGEPLFMDLRLRLEAGRWTCLMGPSGGGKTTLLRLLAGLQPGGRVTASDGRPVGGRLALMAQTDLLLPWLTAIDNVLLGWRLRGGRRARSLELRERARALLARVGLADRAFALPATLSGGMRQRVALARTLMEDRPIVLMDEPFSALDAITRYRLQDLAAELLAGRTVLHVTHDPLEAARLGQVLLVLGGQPARLAPVPAPGSPPPRAPDGPEIAGLHKALLDRIAGAEQQPQAPAHGRAA